MEQGVQSATLKSYFSAIKYILKQDGYEWNDKQVILDSLVKSCKIKNDQVKVRLPIKRALLEMLLGEIGRWFGMQNPQPYLEKMYKAMFCLAYYGMMRVGELTLSPHTLKAGHIHVGNNKDKIMVVLYSSKTHGAASRPQKIKIASLPIEVKQQNFCPIRAIQKFMEIRGPYKDKLEQFFVFSDMSPVKPDHFRGILRQLLTSINLNAALYDAHSFRIGRTCDLEKFGFSIDQIKAMGRWKSNAVYRYLKNY